MLPPDEVAQRAILLITGLVLTVAGASDIRSRRIPNWTVLTIAGLFVASQCLGSAVPLKSSLLAASIVFMGSLALYAFGIVGAGDSKLATVVALFVGLARLPEFILYMSLTGGMLAIIVLAAEPTRVLVMLQTRSRKGLGRSVPYGVAIAGAGIGVIVQSLS
jgi:prepilin peptidase CpaA